MKKKVLMAVLAATLLGACSSVQYVSDSYLIQTEVLNTELDGSLTLRVWGAGRNRNDAVEQAKKNAVDEVIFKGVQKGNGSYLARPLTYEVNARERHQNYFNVFFADGGEYAKYVSMEDTRLLSNERQRTKTQVKYGVTVRVLVPQLKAKLMEDGIIKP